MGVLAVMAAAVALVALDWRGIINLSHPVWVLVTVLGYFASVVYTAVLAVLALSVTLTNQGSLGVWAEVAFSILPGMAFGLYVLVKANCLPMGRREASPARKAVRLLDCGLIVGIPLQVLVLGGYVAAAVLLQSVFQGPAWLLPVYPLALAVLWPMAHLVFHVAIVAVAIDPLLILIGILLAIFWIVQEIFLIHGVVRGSLLQGKSAGALAVRVLVALVPVANLVLSIRLRLSLREGRAAAI